MVARLRAWLVGLSDTRLALAAALPLFALAAWPLLLVDLPPLQDLPNHVATVHLLAHPDLYPEYVSNGLAKSNSLLTAWLLVAGGEHLFGAARLFVALVLLAGAVAWPAFLVRFAGRDRLASGTLFAWPLVHGFFVAMGMLNFAFAFALALLLLVALDHQRERASVPRGAGVAALSVVLWYAHPFPLAVVAALVGLHAATRSGWGERRRAGLVVLAPLAPALLLAVGAAGQHLGKGPDAPAVATAGSAWLSPRELIEHLWLDGSGALTWWGASTFVPAVLLPYVLWRTRAGRGGPQPRAERSGPAFFPAAAVAALAIVYVGLPFMLSNWWYLNCRLVPFLWAGLLVRLPSRLPRPLAAVLAASALWFSAVLGVDYARLDRDRAELTAGLPAVPERATLLPLLFAKRKTADFTGNLTHAWAYYVVARNTSAPLVFAVERSYPIRYRVFPPAALIPPALDRMAEQLGTPDQVCAALERPTTDPACAAMWRQLWSSFWAQAEPRFDHVLTWAMPAAARSLIPERYRPVFSAGELAIFARGPIAGDPSVTPP